MCVIGDGVERRGFVLSAGEWPAFQRSKEGGGAGWGEHNDDGGEDDWRGGLTHECDGIGAR